MKDDLRAVRATAGPSLSLPPGQSLFQPISDRTTVKGRGLMLSQHATVILPRSSFILELKPVRAYQGAQNPFPYLTT